MLVQSARGVVEFSSEGERLGRIGGRGLFAPRLFCPRAGGRRWEIDRAGDATLVERNDRAACVVSRGKNRRWIRWIESAAVAPDGGLAPLDVPRGSAFEGDDVWLHLFDGGGAPLASYALPIGFRHAEVAQDGKCVGLRLESSLRLVDAAGRLSSAAGIDRDASLSFSPSGELWMFGDRGLVRRYCVR